MRMMGQSHWLRRHIPHSAGLVSALVFMLGAHLAMSAPAESAAAQLGDDPANGFVITEATPLLFLPLVVAERTYPSTTLTPTTQTTPAMTKVAPSPTPTLPIEVQPPELVYSDCVVRAENHPYADEQISSVVTTTYNSSSRPLSVLYDTDPYPVDGIVDNSTESVYQDEWQQLRWYYYAHAPDATLLSSWNFVYNTMDQLIQKQRDEDGDGTIDLIDEYEYNAAGLLVRNKVNMRTYLYTYDHLQRPTSVYTDFFNDGEVDYGKIYVWSGNVIVAIDDDTDADRVPDRRWNLRYDDHDRLVFAPGLSGDWSYEYDDAGRVTRIETSKSGQWEQTITYDYDPAGRLTRSTYEDHTGENEYIAFTNTCGSSGPQGGGPRGHWGTAHWPEGSSTHVEQPSSALMIGRVIGSEISVVVTPLTSALPWLPVHASDKAITSRAIQGLFLGGLDVSSAMP